MSLRLFGGRLRKGRDRFKGTEIGSLNAQGRLAAALAAPSWQWMFPLRSEFEEETIILLREVGLLHGGIRGRNLVK
jgi:hypothetical protein